MFLRYVIRILWTVLPLGLMAWILFYALSKGNSQLPLLKGSLIISGLLLWFGLGLASRSPILYLLMSLGLAAWICLLIWALIMVVNTVFDLSMGSYNFLFAITLGISTVVATIICACFQKVTKEDFAQIMAVPLLAGFMGLFHKLQFGSAFSVWSWGALPVWTVTAVPFIVFVIARFRFWSISRQA